MMKLFSRLKRGLFNSLACICARRWHKGLHANGLTIIKPNTTIGTNVHSNGLRIYGSGACKIGDHVHIAQGVKILTSNHRYEGETIPYDQKIVSKSVIIEDCVWIGMDVTLLPGAHIREGAIIQAGSVVVNEIPYCAIAGGNPAKPFKQRDVAHYENLKKLNQYH